jgi:hypothetical protein
MPVKCIRGHRPSHTLMTPRAGPCQLRLFMVLNRVLPVHGYAIARVPSEILSSVYVAVRDPQAFFKAKGALR